MSINFADRLKAIKLNIAYYRKKAGFSQEKFAEKLEISRKHLSCIEAPNMKTGVHLEILFAIADALEIDIAKLLEVR